MLDGYISLLEKWSRVHNLTGCSEKSALRNLACDCRPLVLAAAETLGDACDIGSGAGMPGIPLAIANQSRKVCLVESEASKAAFLEQVKIELGLSNVTVVNKRAGDWHPESPMRLVCARGFASLKKLADCCTFFVAAGTRMLVLKPCNPSGEIEEMLGHHPCWKLVRCEKTGNAPSRYLVDAVLVP